MIAPFFQDLRLLPQATQLITSTDDKQGYTSIRNRTQGRWSESKENYNRGVFTGRLLQQCTRVATIHLLAY
jgi:hypothetical protein